MGTSKRTGPVALTTVLTTNIMQGGGGDATKYDKILCFWIANTSSAAAKLFLYLGGSNGNVAGTELWKGVSIPANTVQPFYRSMPLKSTEYLVGGSDTASALTLTIDYEQNIVP